MDAQHLDLFDGKIQVFFGWNTQHDERTGFLRLLKSVAGFQASVADLDDLIGERNVRANQNVGIARRWLRLRH